MVRAGIKVNGISATRSPYPFYKSFTQTIDLQKGTTLSLSPTVSYTEDTDFAFMEDFENVGVTLDSTHYSDTTLQLLTTPNTNVFEGNKSAIAYLDKENTFFECITLNSYELPTGGAPVFLEFNYKCNYPFSISVKANGSSTSEQLRVISYNSNETWNKAYIYLTPVVSNAYSADNYQVLWGMLNDVGSDSLYLMLDNIKLVH
jgi:hypothetical protein